jgi:hypothetical protein
VELARGLRQRDIAKVKREEKGWRELKEKRRGDDSFITCQMIGWHIERGPTPYKAPRVVRVVTGPLCTPDVASLRYSDSQSCR